MYYFDFVSFSRFLFSFTDKLFKTSSFYLPLGCLCRERLLDSCYGLGAVLSWERYRDKNFLPSRRSVFQQSFIMRCDNHSEGWTAPSPGGGKGAGDDYQCEEWHVQSHGGMTAVTRS